MDQCNHFEYFNPRQLKLLKYYTENEGKQKIALFIFQGEQLILQFQSDLGWILFSCFFYSFYSEKADHKSSGSQQVHPFNVVWSEQCWSSDYSNLAVKSLPQLQ